jgi:GT2 family glycosyltransferase
VRTEIYHNRDLSWVQNQPNNIQLDYVCGAAMFLSVAALKNIGLLNQQFFLYYEELDLAQRLKNAGYQLGWCKTSVVHHQQHTKKDVDKHHQQFLHYHENLSTLTYTWLHHRRLFVFAATFRLLAKTIVLPLTHRTRLLPSLFKAYYDFYRHCCRTNQRYGTETPLMITASLFLKK